jgi:hypothetical protein
MEEEVILSKDNVQECPDLVGSLLVVVHYLLGSGEVEGFLYGDINIEIFDIECEQSVMVANFSFTNSLAIHNNC